MGENPNIKTDFELDEDTPDFSAESIDKNNKTTFDNIGEQIPFNPDEATRLKNDIEDMDELLPDRTSEQRSHSRQILSRIQTQMVNDNRQTLTDFETAFICANTDYYDFINNPEMKNNLTHSLIGMVDEAANKDWSNNDKDRDELFQIARIIEEDQVASDLLKEAIDNGAELNQAGIQNIGDIIGEDYSKSDTGIAEGLIRAEKIGYGLFNWNGADNILLRGPSFQETLSIERGISPNETDILYSHLKYYIEHSNYGEEISDLLNPSDDNNFAKLWLKDKDNIINIFSRTRDGDECYRMIDEDGRLTEVFAQNLIDNFSVNNATENEFISRHLELFSDEKMKEELFGSIFGSPERYGHFYTSQLRDCGIKEFFRLAGSKSYDDNMATSWFVSFISSHALEEKNLFAIDSPEDFTNIAEIASVVTANGAFDGMCSYRTDDEKDKPWAKADYGLIENCMVLWQFNNPEEREMLPRFLDAGNLEDIDYSKEFPNFAEKVRMYVFNNEDEVETSPTKDEIINLIINSIRNRDPYANEYSNFLYPNDDDEEQSYWKKHVDSSDDYYKHFAPEAIKQVPRVLTTLLTTSVEELIKNYDIIADRVLTHSPENATQVVKNLESIYLRKDIPKFAKLYYSADMLFMDSLDGEKNSIPPFLKLAISGENKKAENAREVIMTDLLKNAIKSNNSSLRAYLKSCLNSEENPDSQSSKGEDSKLNSDDDNYIEEFTDNKKFRRRFFGYAGKLGYENAEHMLKAMDTNRDLKNSMHKSNVIIDSEGNARYARTFEPGDLIKGINMGYLHLSMQDGFNCPELTGIGARHDYTHWDTDFGSVRSEDADSSIDEKISNSMADGYGDGIYAIVHRGGFLGYDSSEGDPGLYNSFALYEIYHRNHSDNFRGIRTGIGSEDIDAYVVNSDNYSRIEALRLEYEMAKNGIYSPIIDRESEEVIFTPDDFEKLRQKMGGMNNRYETLPSKFEVAENLSLPDNLINKSGVKYSDLVDGYYNRTREGAISEGGIRGQIIGRFQLDKSYPKVIREAFIDLLFKSKDDRLNGPIDIIATGSTARGTNLPDDADLDIILRLDRGIYDNYKDRIIESLTTRYDLYYGGKRPAIEGGTITNRGIRKGFVDVATPQGFVEVEVDISPVVTTNQRTFFSEEAAKERLKSSHDHSIIGQVAANIVMAKALLKDAHAYKTNRSPEHEGGLGGLGVENWILQSGGSLRQACEEFLSAANDGQGGYVSFDDFCSRYAVFDMGENHFGNNYESPYDNFVEKNMNEDGYRRMCDTCRSILQQINNAEP